MAEITKRVIMTSVMKVGRDDQQKHELEQSRMTNRNTNRRTNKQNQECFNAKGQYGTN